MEAARLYGTGLGVLEPQRGKVEGVDVSVKGSNLVILAHVVLHPLGQKQSLCAVKGGLVSALVHLVFVLRQSTLNFCDKQD